MKPLLLAAVAFLTVHVGFSQRNIATLQNITTTKAINGKVFFVATHDELGIELFVSDGKIGDHKILKDINPGNAGSFPSELTIFHDQLFFTAYLPDYGQSIWKSDGTPQGTQLIYAVKNAEPRNLTIFKDKLYFTTALGSIVRTDGTSAGTQTYYQSQYTWARIRTFKKDDQHIYFSMDGRTIYRDDGYSRIDFLGPLSWEDVYFKDLFVLDNTLVVIKSSTYDNVIRVYAISHDVLGDELEDEWTLIKKLDAPIYGDQEIDNFTNVSGKLFFSFRTYYDNVPPSDELWICDGTEPGTKLVKSFGWSPHSYDSEMGMFFAYQNKLFFRGGDPVNRALWTSNGTSEGTNKFYDVVLTAPYNDERTPVLVTENKIFFSGSKINEYNAELWSSNGTAEGTKQILDLEDNGGSTPRDFSYSNEVLYFVTTQQFSATLWSTEPTADISLTGKWGNNLKSGSKHALFYDVAKGSCNTANLTISNKGLGALYLSNIFITGKDFYITQKSLPETIAPGESTPLEILFNPVSDGKASATLTILSNDADESRYVIYLEATPASFTAKEICHFSESEYIKSLEPEETPKAIKLSGSTINEGHPKGTVVGNFILPASATFLLTGGEGADDNQDFFIEGNQLKTNTVFNFNLKNVYSIRVKSTLQGVESETSIRIHVSNSSHNLTNENCQPVFEQISFSYTSLEANAEGHLFATTSNGQILRSMNAGQSWEIVYSVNYYFRLTGITFKGNTGYAHGGNALLKSDDGGATWFNLYIPYTKEYYVNDISVFFLNDKEGYVGTEDGEIFYTSDGGRTWETRLEGSWKEFRKMNFTSKVKGFATVDWGDLVKTIDGGRSWTAVDLSALGWNTRVQDFWFKNDNEGFLVLQYKFYKTLNGGETWIEVTNVSVGDVTRIKFFNENLGYLYGSSGILYKTTNKGSTWNQIAPGISLGLTVGIAEASGKLFMANRSYYGYDAARSLAMSSDNGVTWSILNYFTDANIYRIDFSHDNTGIVIGEYGIFKTEDHGLTWHQKETDLTNIADIYFIDQNTAIIVSGGNIYKSTDGGTTTRNVLTTEQSEHYYPAGKLYSFPGNILFAVSWYAVYRSDDLGETWQMVSVYPGYYTQGLHFISSAIGYRVELFGSVEKTIDGGKTWLEIFTREPDASDPFNTIFFLDEIIGYKGGDFLQRTKNGGISWEKVDWPIYEIMAIHFENVNHGYVVTQAGYVYETHNAGVTWKIAFSAPNRISDAQFHNNTIFLAGERGFVARMNTRPAPPTMPGYIYGPDKVCVGDATEFHLATNNNYYTQWSTTALNLNDNNESITVRFQSPGEYFITAKNINSCGISESRTTTITVSSPPEAAIIEGPDFVASGEQDVAYSVINGEQDYEYIWQAEGSLNFSHTNNNILVDWANNIQNGKIKVLMSNAAGCRSYGTFDVAVVVPVAVENNLRNQVNIYPNPTAGDAKIISSYQGLVFVRITDAIGREYFRTSHSVGEEQTIPTQQLPAGLYFIEISDGLHSVTKKLIRN